MAGLEDDRARGAEVLCAERRAVGVDDHISRRIVVGPDQVGPVSEGEVGHTAEVAVVAAAAAVDGEPEGAAAEELAVEFRKYLRQGLDPEREMERAKEERQKGNFEKAGKIVGDRIMEDEIVYAVGCGGHSYIPPMDMFCRAGSLVPVSATLDVSTTALTGGIRCLHLERVPGYMVGLFKYFRIKKNDVVIIFNNYLYLG